MKLTFEKIEKIYFIFISLGLLFISLNNTQRIEFNSFSILYEQIVLLAYQSLNKLENLLIICQVYIFLFLIGPNIVGYPLVFPTISPNLLNQSISLFISCGLLIFSFVDGIEGFTYLIFLCYIFISTKNNSEHLSKKIINGLPYLVFLPNVVYIFGIKGIIFGCLILFITNCLILFGNPFSCDNREVVIIDKRNKKWKVKTTLFLNNISKLLSSYLKRSSSYGGLPNLTYYFIYSLPYLIIVPLSTLASGFPGTIISCIGIYLIYILNDIYSNKGLPEVHINGANRGDPYDHR